MLEMNVNTTGVGVTLDLPFCWHPFCWLLSLCPRVMTLSTKFPKTTLMNCFEAWIPLDSSCIYKRHKKYLIMDCFYLIFYSNGEFLTRKSSISSFSWTHDFCIKPAKPAHSDVPQMVSDSMLSHKQSSRRSLGSLWRATEFAKIIKKIEFRRQNVSDPIV